MGHYPDVDPRPHFPRIEERILERWKDRRTFERSVEQRPPGDQGSNEFVFYDGPPFANGLPHYGHIVTGYVKDIVPRYHTMRGARVERRFGWDCHGLPAEMESEKELGISGRLAILDHGIGAFNQHCRSSVMKYTAEWERYVTRMARWVDFKNDYKTMDLPYMESVLWAFAELWKKGLIYQGYKVVPYSWAAETVLSNFETRLDNSYRERQDPAITVRIRLTADDGADPLTLLVWTTTPWTLPSNLAVAVGEDIEYAVFEKDGERLALAAAAVPRYEAQLEDARPTGTMLGKALVGRRYSPLFPYFADTEGAFRVLAGDFVNTEEGTGVVHLAPGFGEDDQIACERAGIPVVCPVDDRGRFTSEVRDYQGLLVFDANKPIIRDLEQRGALLRHDSYVHNYPHCWRTDEPLIFKAVSSWYVKVTEFRDRMVELNRTIHWVPEHVRDGSMGKWLEGARDWAISRNRFWGTPLPVWQSDDPAYPRTDVYGSLDELERDFGVRLTDLHRPGIDELTRPNPDDPSGQSTMRRVAEVFDCWFESGSMPFAQVHYPFENKQWFDRHSPADFVVEYIAQTRGWFYTLIVLGTALFDRPPFENCICHGVVVDEKGTKLSKRLRNYPDPEQVFSTIGSDALRWFLCSATLLRGHNLAIDREGKGIAEVVRLTLQPLWNAYRFFCMYANADGLAARTGVEPEQVLDRYILAKTRELVEGVSAHLDAYDVTGACTRVSAFIDALNNWYIRSSRDRFWKAKQDRDKQQAYDTLYRVLTTTCRTLAPLLPFITEEIYTGLTGEESVHLADWPDPEALPADPALVRDMDRVRQVCTAAHSLRKAHRLRARLPLARLTIAGADAARLAPYADLIRAEVNVKEVATETAVEQFGEFQLKVNARVVGPRLGGDMQRVMAAAREGQWTSRDDGTVELAGHTLGDGDFELELRSKKGVVSQALPGNDMLVALDVRVTPELEREGVARDVVRQVQQARKHAGFDITDRIGLWIDGSAAIRAAVETHRDSIMEQTLATELTIGAPPADTEHTTTAELDGEPLTIAVKRLGTG